MQVSLAAGPLLSVTVADEGAGPPADAHRRLQGHADEGEAGGLGLEVIATLARRLGASLLVEQGHGGVGTRVTLAVPTAQ